MKKRFILVIVMFVFIILSCAIAVIPTYAQQPISTPNIPIASATPDTQSLERRIYQLEIEQAQTIETLKSSNEFNRFLITVTGVIVGLLVSVQAISTAVQLRREGKREQRETQREEKRDQTELIGVEQVSKIMGVVHQTLESRLAAEEEARKAAIEAQRRLKEVLDEVGTLDLFYKSFQTNIENTRETIEKSALKWASTVARHDFRRMADELNNFALRFDEFKANTEPLEEKKRSFSPRVSYIRGIAAHYANQPEIAKQYLSDVLTFHQPESDEDPIAYNRRVANANYYLGLIEANFGNSQNAIDFFERANKLDLQGRDFLTRIVTAEAYVMINDLYKANLFITEVEEKIQGIEKQDGRLRNFHLRLRSRAALIRANMAILNRQANWQEEVQRLLEPVYVADPEYYFSTVTLAQSYAFRNNKDRAEKLFSEANAAIVSSSDLYVVKEVRSKILLLMVAGMCSKQSHLENRRSDDLLDQADILRGGLPTIGSQVCTVFSTFNKRNENSETIRQHIDSIRAGQVLQESRI